jgi:hypothetical protein
VAVRKSTSTIGPEDKYETAIAVVSHSSIAISPLSSYCSPQSTDNAKPSSLSTTHIKVASLTSLASASNHGIKSPMRSPNFSPSQSAIVCHRVRAYDEWLAFLDERKVNERLLLPTRKGTFPRI